MKNQGGFYTLGTDLLLKVNLPQSEFSKWLCVVPFSTWGKNHLYTYMQMSHLMDAENLTLDQV